MSETNFEVGDTCEAFGCEGVIKEVGSYSGQIEVLFENGRTFQFWENGKYFDWAKEPQLKLISKAKKKVERWQWVVKDNFGGAYSGIYWFTEEEVKKTFAERLIGKDPNCHIPFVSEE